MKIKFKSKSNVEKYKIQGNSEFNFNSKTKFYRKIRKFFNNKRNFFNKWKRNVKRKRSKTLNA